MYYQYELTHFKGDMGHGVASDEDDGEPAESEFEQLMEHHLRDVKRRLCA